MTIHAFEGSFPTIADHAYIDESAYVSGDVEISQHASVWPTAVIRGDINPIRVGEMTNIQDGSVLHVTHDSRFQPGGADLIIGHHVTVGHRVVLHGCKISDYCLIGMGSIILDNAQLPSYTMVGAGSLVPSGKELMGGYLWLGCPARKIRTLTDQEIEFFEYSAQHYKALKDRTIASR